MDDINITLIALEDTYFYKNDINKYTNDSTRTDLCTLTRSIESDPSTYFIKSLNNVQTIAIDDLGYSHVESISTRHGIRPVLELPEELFNEIVGNSKSNYVYFGEYPQNASHMNERLEEKYREGELHKTGNIYTFDNSDHSIDSEKNNNTFIPVTYAEYEYHNKKYIRLKINPKLTNPLGFNGGVYVTGDYVWIEVSPIRWLPDYKNKRLISAEVLVSGIRFHNPEEKVDTFEETELYDYMKKYLLPEILQSEKRKREKEVIENITISGSQLSSMEDIIGKDKNLSKEELEELLNAMNQMKNEKTRK